MSIVGRSGTRSRRRRSRRPRSPPPRRAPARRGRARPRCSRRRAAGRRRRSRAACSRPASSPCRGSGPTASFFSVCSNSSITPAAASLDAEPERLGDLALDLGARALGVELDVAAEEVVGVDAPEHEVEVGDRDRLEPALGPADADPRAGRVRPELGPARVRVDAHERAGAGADRVDLDQRHVEHEAGDVRRLGDLEPAVGDQRDVEAGAADVGAEDVRELHPLGELRGRRRRRRSAPRPASAPAPCASIEIVPPCEAMTRSSKPAPASFVSLADRLQRAARGLGRVGLDQGRVEPREVAAHRVELRGEEDRHLAVRSALGLLLVDDLRHPQLVLGVAVAEQERDADPLDAGVEQLARRLAHVLLAERDHLVAEDVDAPAHALHRARAGRAARCGSGSRGAGGRSRSSRGRSGSRARAAGSPPARR